MAKLKDMSQEEICGFFIDFFYRTEMNRLEEEDIDSFEQCLKKAEKKVLLTIEQVFYMTYHPIHEKWAKKIRKNLHKEDKMSEFKLKEKLKKQMV